MNRIYILQKLIDKNNFKSYLEIGTFQGESLLPLKCKKKIAVDPKFQISKKKKFKWILENPTNLRNQYFEMTSDQFFRSKHQFLKKRGSLDIVFIDGLHTFRASLNDCLNSLKYLNRKGFIVMHDCFPPNKAAATPAKSFEAAEKMGVKGWRREWCGDVWKTIVYLKNKYQKELEIIVLNTDYGLGIIKFEMKQNFSVDIDEELFNEIDKKDYEFLESNPDKLLGLREIHHEKDFSQFLEN